MNGRAGLEEERWRQGKKEIGFEEYMGKEKGDYKAKMGMYKGIVVQSVLYVSETWNINGVAVK